MPPPQKFPHLQWIRTGEFEVKFSGGRSATDEEKEARADRKKHVAGISDDIEAMRKRDEKTRKARERQQLPEIKGHGFLIKVPEDTDVDGLAHAIGVELVAETEHGLMFAASEDLEFERLSEVLEKFGLEETGGGKAASIVEIFNKGDDKRKLVELLRGDVLAAWPFEPNQIYLFDLGIHSASDLRKFEFTRKPRRLKKESEESHQARVDQVRKSDHLKATEEWDNACDERCREVLDFISYYEGEVVVGRSEDEPIILNTAIHFPDSIQMRIRMSGRGFSDLVRNFPHLFEVALPPEIGYLPGSAEADGENPDLEFEVADEGAPTVCVIDSGIQEDHKWIEPAIDWETSRCFIPELAASEVADYVEPRGHGTRVAGAVLYPAEVPKEGTVKPVAWIQNARVLDGNSEIPKSLPPERYLEEVAAHFRSGSFPTKIFNHSIAGNGVCPNSRMSAWAAKLDDLSHRHDILFIQSAGNLNPVDFAAEFGSEYEHPEQLLEDFAAISDPGQSLHALTVGSVSDLPVELGSFKSSCREPNHPSSFSRSGHSPLWDVIKPEVVEIGGDYLLAHPDRDRKICHGSSSPELLASTMYGQPAISRDDLGTSFTAPKVAHIAAALQRIFPDASPLLYRALIVQSAQWPEWALNENVEMDDVLRLIGYGIPSLARATENNPHRMTFVTADSVEIPSKRYHLYRIEIPEEIRRASEESKVRIDVTLAYTASPRRTRSRRTGYLETWLDWQSNKNGESAEEFASRMEGTAKCSLPGYKWQIHSHKQYGETTETRRDLGTVQRDWMTLEANALPEEFAIAVRSHRGWNHKEYAAHARYCLVVSFESLGAELDIYSAIRNTVEIDLPVEIEV